MSKVFTYFCFYANNFTFSLHSVWFKAAISIQKAYDTFLLLFVIVLRKTNQKRELAGFTAKKLRNPSELKKAKLTHVESLSHPLCVSPSLGKLLFFPPLVSILLFLSQKPASDVWGWRVLGRSKSICFPSTGLDRLCISLPFFTSAFFSPSLHAFCPPHSRSVGRLLSAPCVLPARHILLLERPSAPERAAAACNLFVHVWKWRVVMVGAAFCRVQSIPFLIR